jgi:hypothetical protein
MRQLLPCVFALVIAAPASAATYTVTSADDDGLGTLRQAILDANDHVGADTIAFAITGPGVHTIAPTSELPPISEMVFIDGYSQPGSQANTNLPQAGGLNGVLRIELCGANIPGSQARGLRLDTGVGLHLRGLVVNRFASAIDLGGNSDEPIEDVLIEGCYLGTNASGTVAFANQRNGVVDGNRSGGRVTIGGTTAAARNLISGFSGNSNGWAVILTPTPEGPVIQGNLIGTNAAGILALPNANGIAVESSNTVQAGYGTRIGGDTPAARNLISGNAGDAVRIGCGASSSIQCGDGTQVRGNFIGSTIAGDAPLPNGRSGVYVLTPQATTTHMLIGGDTPDSENLIAWNGRAGFMLSNDSKGIVEIARNRIFANAGVGIDLPNPSPGRTPNDTHDSDGGYANRGQNFPVIAAAHQVGNQLTVYYTVPTATNYATYPLTIRWHDALDGHWLAQDIYDAIDAEVQKQFVATLPAGVQPSRLMATATDAAGNTSELSDVFLLDHIFTDGFDP